MVAPPVATAASLPPACYPLTCLRRQPSHAVIPRIVKFEGCSSQGGRGVQQRGYGRTPMCLTVTSSTFCTGPSALFSSFVTGRG